MEAYVFWAPMGICMYTNLVEGPLAGLTIHAYCVGVEHRGHAPVTPNEEAQTLMARTFIKVNYDTAVNITVRLGDCVSSDHLARFIVDVIALLDLTAIYARYGPRGAPAYAPEILLGLLFYGYATGVFSTRQIEQATYESLPFRFIAGDRHPDHDTLAHFRKTFLPEITTLFAQVLLIAYEAGVLKLGAISLDGTKIHADASKSKAVSYHRLIEI